MKILEVLRQYTKFYYGSFHETLESSSKSMKLKLKKLLPCSYGFNYCKLFIF